MIRKSAKNSEKYFMDKVSAVVINYDGKNYLDKCLNELTKHSELFEIIVVDDASTDGSSELVKEKYKGAKLIINPKNSGPVYSRQIGFEEAKGEYILFIDCDIVIQKDTVEKLHDFLEKNKDFWLAGAKLYEKDGHETPWNYGHFPNIWKNFILNFLGGDSYIATKTRRADWVAEACFMVRKDVLKRIGGFDLKLFMYHEAPDISMRANRKGYKTAIVFEAKATHLGQKSRRKEGDRFKLFNEALRYFYKKHYSFLPYIGISAYVYLYFLFRKLGFKNKTHYE